VKGIPDLTPVKSSNIQSMGHDGSRLFVRFKNGTLYSYEGVSQDAYKAGLEADSVGKWFRGEISGKKFLKHDA
jgi:hypothetical protein